MMKNKNLSLILLYILFLLTLRVSLSEIECFGIDSEDSTRCSEHGECVSFNSCECDDNFLGFNCQKTNESTYYNYGDDIIYFTTPFKGNWEEIKNYCFSQGGVVAIPLNESNEEFIAEKYLDEMQLIFGINYNQFSNELTISTGSIYEKTYLNFINSDYDIENYEYAITISFSPDIFSNGWNYVNVFDTENRGLCSIYTCNNTIGNDSNICNGNGKCIFPDECECDRGYGNDYCKDQIGQTTEWDFEDKEIFVTNETSNHSYAQTQCENKGGNLYIPNTIQEEKAIGRILADDGFDLLWIGLTIDNDNILRSYPDGNVFNNYTSWADGFPFRSSGNRGIVSHIYPQSNDGLTPDPNWLDLPDIRNIYKGLCIK